MKRLILRLWRWVFPRDRLVRVYGPCEYGRGMCWICQSYLEMVDDHESRDTVWEEPVYCTHCGQVLYPRRKS